MWARPDRYRQNRRLRYPIIEHIEKGAKHIQAIILVPTRELAIQVSEEMNSFKGKKRYRYFRSTAVSP